MTWPESPPPAVIPLGAARPLARTSSAISRAMDRKSRLCLAVRASGVWRLSALELPAATFSATKARATNKINETNFPTSHPLGPGARPGYFRLVPKPRPRASEDREPRSRETLISRAPHRGDGWAFLDEHPGGNSLHEGPRVGEAGREEGPRRHHGPRADGADGRGLRRAASGREGREAGRANRDRRVREGGQRDLRPGLREGRRGEQNPRGPAGAREHRPLWLRLDGHSRSLQPGRSERPPGCRRLPTAHRGMIGFVDRIILIGYRGACSNLAFPSTLSLQ